MISPQFPVYIGLGAWKIHPHFLFEFLGYVVAFRLLLRRNLRSDTLSVAQRSSVVAGGMVGAVLGAKALVLLQHMDLLWLDWRQWLWLVAQGKTIVGALLGGLIGVEVTKSWIGVTQSTGDVFVYPLLVGTAIGRMGCFLTGLRDRTYGTMTTLPWGVDFGDGILRHPTQLYEIIFLVILGIALAGRKKYPHHAGDLFQMYLAGYLGFRFLIDFLKPDFHPLLGLSAVQVASLLGFLYACRQLSRRSLITP
ncbi:prolipoprotein diacylglyceryl transferase [Leptothoe sp. PORK10 BA2]|uniref:prolipoprotein diacylglyceryl transferase n=1 Tax=Leptothoe sp. PORK10 BA2 TaxID=3110254 RepID=UPI002B1FEFF5|nr:prolipoprotein diacylglyceryl transferase family protein [Leptothoe sp. PORK10 BA2]MEA5466225.1 prolipoprotein diacylglyceryl transferase family protein [Leptothoe sp. PORK10 BA2]